MIGMVHGKNNKEDAMQQLTLKKVYGYAIVPARTYVFEILIRRRWL